MAIQVCYHFHIFLVRIGSSVLSEVTIRVSNFPNLRIKYFSGSHNISSCETNTGGCILYVEAVIPFLQKILVIEICMIQVSNHKVAARIFPGELESYADL